MLTVDYQDNEVVVRLVCRVCGSLMREDFDNTGGFVCGCGYGCSIADVIGSARQVGDSVGELMRLLSDETNRAVCP